LGHYVVIYDHTVFRSVADPILDLKPPSVYMSVEQERRELDLLAKKNAIHAEMHPAVSDLSARISSYELAYRMQGCAPEAVDLNQETEETRKLYGLDDKVTEPFGRQCLLARRLIMPDDVDGGRRHQRRPLPGGGPDYLESRRARVPAPPSGSRP
jgi:Protein of unknown function (DUF1501)